MKIKKTAAKDFHLGNRLNGNGNEMRAKYGIFSESGDQVGFVTFSGGTYDAFFLKGGRINDYGCPTLSALKAHLATK